MRWLSSLCWAHRSKVWKDMMQRILVALVMLAVAGCAGLGAYRDPVRVTVSSVEVLESTMLEQLYRVTLRVQNHNDQALTIRGGSFDLVLNGGDFGSGVTDSEVTVPAFGDAKVEVRMVSTMFGMLRLFQGLAERGPEGGVLRYRISGRFSVDGVFGGVRFDDSGELSIPVGTRGGAS
jgi:LEA14-like dessication related protein